MKTLPYFRWYPADAETDELYSGMTDQELGFYHRCLNRSWINDGLPADLDSLAATIKVKRSYLDKVWVKVGKCFTLTDTVSPRLVNPRQEKERQHATSKSERATDSVRTRYERRTNELPRAQARAESESESESVSESVSVSDTPSEVLDCKRKKASAPIPFPPTAPSWQIDETFTPFVEAWQEVSRETGKPLIPEDFSDAHFRWGRMDFQQKLQATHGVRERLRVGEWSGATDPKFIPLPARYLEKEYKRPVVMPKSREPPTRQGFVEGVAEVIAGRIARGEPPL